MKYLLLSLCATVLIAGAAVADTRPTLEDSYRLCVESLQYPMQAETQVQKIAQSFEDFEQAGFWKAQVTADVGRLAIVAQPGMCSVEGFVQNGDVWNINVVWADVRKRSDAFLNDPVRGILKDTMEIDTGAAKSYCTREMQPYRIAHSARSNMGEKPPLYFSATSTAPGIDCTE